MSEDLKDRLVVNSRLYDGPHPDDRRGFAAFAAVSRARQLLQGVSDRVHDAYAGQGAAEAARRDRIRGQYRKEANAIHSLGRDDALWFSMSDEQRQQFAADDDAGLVPTHHPLSVTRYEMVLEEEDRAFERVVAGWSDARRREFHSRDSRPIEHDSDNPVHAFDYDDEPMRHPGSFETGGDWIEPRRHDLAWEEAEIENFSKDHWKFDAAALRHLKDAAPHELTAAFNALTFNDRAWLQSDYAGGLVPIDHPFNPVLQAQSEVSRIANYGRDVERQADSVEIWDRDPNRWLDPRDVSGLRHERTYLHGKEMYDDEVNGTRGLTKSEARRVDEIDARLSIHEIALGEYLSWYKAAEATPETHDAYRDAWAKTEELAEEACRVRGLGTWDELVKEKAGLEADRAARAANRLAVLQQRANLEEGLAPQDRWNDMTSSERIKVAMAYADHPRGPTGWYEGPLKHFDLKAELAGAEQEWARMHPMDRLLQVHDYEAKQAGVVPIARRWADQGPLPAHPFAAQIQREHQNQLDAAKEVARERTLKETKFETGGPRLRVVSSRSMER